MPLKINTYAFFKRLSGAAWVGNYFGRVRSFHFEGELKTEAGGWISGLSATDLASSHSLARVIV